MSVDWNRGLCNVFHKVKVFVSRCCWIKTADDSCNKVSHGCCRFKVSFLSVDSNIQLDNIKVRVHMTQEKVFLCCFLIYCCTETFIHNTYFRQSAVLFCWHSKRPLHNTYDTFPSQYLWHLPFTVHMTPSLHVQYLWHKSEVLCHKHTETFPSQYILHKSAVLLCWQTETFP